MKQYYSGMLAACLLCSGCTALARNEEPEPVYQTEAEPVTKQEDPEPSEEYTFQMEEGEFSMRIDEEHWKIDMRDGRLYLLSKDPVEPEDDPALSIWFSDWWGVCGTGLEIRKTDIGERTAEVGYYDGNEYWDYAVFPLEEEMKFIVAKAGGPWSQEMSEAAQKMLESIRITR